MRFEPRRDYAGIQSRIVEFSFVRVHQRPQPFPRGAQLVRVRHARAG
jgi:hypothetical protein